MTMQTFPKKRHATSPIEEVICEFEFSQVGAWDPHLPTRLYDEMRSVYPTPPQQVTAENSTLSERSHGPKILLTTADGKYQARCGDMAMTLHALRPYPGWADVYDRIAHALRNYLQVAKPKAIAQINLTYRNRIMVPAQSLLMSDYFTLGTTIPHGLPKRFISFATGFRAAYDHDPHSVLSVSFSASPPQHDVSLAVEANIDVMTSRIQLHEAVELETLLEIVRDLKAKAYDAFEKLITDHTRKLYGR
jgi:uncharacterized protein (TIGR04255 family)